MAYLLVDRFNGTSEKFAVKPTQTFSLPVDQGDDVRVVDAVGNHLSGQAVAEGEDLRLLLSDQSEVCLQRFYCTAPEAAPITVALDLVSENSVVETDYDDIEIQIDEHPTSVADDAEELIFSYETLSTSGEIITETVTVAVNGSRDCPLMIEDSE